ncbi:MAG: hypothetical protein HYV97_04480 [Bdellovibrio sp.]|nr:hypothetical protein [Bdellovibrio sp.]
MSVKASCFVVWLFFLCTQNLSIAQDYPSSWWKPVSRDGAPSWEILPQDAGPGEVVLSKRHELGVFSNFGEAPFVLDNLRYNSVEGLWQMMKYPDPEWASDPRHKIDASVWRYTRDQVMSMVGFEAKNAGDLANKIYTNYGLKLISYQGEAFDYKDMGPGSERHFQIIREAIRQKVLQNFEVKALLLKTKGLKLIPDHNVGSGKPKSYYYFDILMDIRDREL